MIFPLEYWKTKDEYFKAQKDNKFINYQERYCTWEEAEAWHKRACEYVENNNH